MTSGVIQNTVPCMAVKAPPTSSSVLSKIPKSDILQVPDTSIRIMSSDKIPTRLEIPASLIELVWLFPFEFNVATVEIAVDFVDRDNLVAVDVSICTVSLGFSSDCIGGCGLTIHYLRCRKIPKK